MAPHQLAPPSHCYTCPDGGSKCAAKAGSLALVLRRTARNIPEMFFLFAFVHVQSPPFRTPLRPLQTPSRARVFDLDFERAATSLLRQKTLCERAMCVFPSFVFCLNKHTGKPDDLRPDNTRGTTNEQSATSRRKVLTHAVCEHNLPDFHLFHDRRMCLVGACS
jgi:hypothetical protein